MCRPVIGVVTVPACCGRAGGTIQQVAQRPAPLNRSPVPLDLGVDTGPAHESVRHALESPGRCTGCTHQLYLTREDARDCVQIHTVDPLPFASEGRSKSDIAPPRFFCTVRRGRCAASTTTRSASIGTSRPSPCVATRLSTPRSADWRRPEWRVAIQVVTHPALLRFIRGVGLRCWPPETQREAASAHRHRNAATRTPRG